MPSIMYSGTQLATIFQAGKVSLHKRSGAFLKVLMVHVQSVRNKYPETDDDLTMIGPTIVSKSLIPDPSLLHIRGLKNGEVKQDCGTEYVLKTVDLWSRSDAD